MQSTKGRDMSDHPDNEPILSYAPGSAERIELQAEMDRQMSHVTEIPCVINGEEIFTGNTMLTSPYLIFRFCVRKTRLKTSFSVVLKHNIVSILF